MKTNKQLLIVLVLLYLTASVFALNVKFDKNSSYPTSIQVDEAINDFIAEINKDIEDINYKPEKLIKSFANASVFASHAATQRAVGDYKRFFISVGPMVGLQAPSGFKGIIDELKNISDMGDLLGDDGDIALGGNLQGAFQFSLNSSFLIDGLYLGLRLGYLNLSDIIPNVNFKIFHIGPVAHYRLVDGINIGILKWRGITANTGLLFQKTNLNINYEVDFNESSSFISIDKPSLVFDMDISTFTIPLEVNTGIQLLWFLNINAGIGTDISFGRNDTSLSLRSTVHDTYQNKDIGELTLTAGGKMNPKSFNLKAMGNLGLKFGPVLIDVPITYYFGAEPGLSFGLTFGAVF
jgi:hypothetical protein